MSLSHLNQTELCRRWRLSPYTLERWRWLGQGPRFLKIGGKVLYRLEDIEAFEAEHLRQGTGITVPIATATPLAAEGAR
ncbi:putative site-specific integrase-resolvase [uncultured Gammaproteobacteria bacterium]